MRRSRARLGRAVVLLAAALVVLPGCVRRRYTIRTNVPAVVFVNGEELGPTPASREFVYYGDRDVILTAPGYQTMRVRQPIKAPWWDNLVTEFFTENLVPYTFRDERVLDYTLVPIASPPPDELVRRAEGLRERAKTPPPERRRGLLGLFGF